MEQFTIDSENYHRTPAQFTYNNVCYGGFVRKDILENQNLLECREDDCFVVSYPKSGTTWVLEVAYLVLNNGDIEASSSVPHADRIPFMEYCREEFGWDYVAKMTAMTSPRLIKSHLRPVVFPRQAFTKLSKFIYVARNPKDVAVSFYHFYKSSDGLGYYTGTFSDFLRLFLNNLVTFGDWFDHVLDWWKYTKTHQSQVLFLKYEDMKRDPRDLVVQVAKHLNRQLADDVMDKISSYCSFDSMKRNPSVNWKDQPDVDSSVSEYIRKGIVGDWKNYFTVAENEAFDRIYEDKMKDSGLRFEW
ncbi:sulfotransferase 1E1-like [Glandiceps talaboti]